MSDGEVVSFFDSDDNRAYKESYSYCKLSDVAAIGHYSIHQEIQLGDFIVEKSALIEVW
jgi:hypothetical protein